MSSTYIRHHEAAFHRADSHTRFRGARHGTSAVCARSAVATCFNFCRHHPWSDWLQLDCGRGSYSTAMHAAYWVKQTFNNRNRSLGSITVHVQRAVSVTVSSFSRSVVNETKNILYRDALRCQLVRARAARHDHGQHDTPRLTSHTDKSQQTLSIHSAVACLSDADAHTRSWSRSCTQERARTQRLLAAASSMPSHSCGSSESSPCSTYGSGA